MHIIYKECRKKPKENYKNVVLYTVLYYIYLVSDIDVLSGMEERLYSWTS